MEADLDLADKLRATEKELSGEELINEHYVSQKTSYNDILNNLSARDMKPQSTIDPVLQRPTTPGHLRQAVTTHAIDSLVNSLPISDNYNSQSGGFESIRFTESAKKRLSPSDEPIISDD